MTKDEETEKVTGAQLFMVEQRTDPLKAPVLTPVQLEHLKKLIKTCKVEFRFQKPLIVNAPPITIEGLKVIRQEELEDGSTLVEFEIPEGVDPETLARLWRPFGPIDPEQDFHKDYDL